MSPFAKAGLIALAITSLAAMLQLDRMASAPLLPSDAFSLRTPTGVGLWLALLLCITFSPLQIYVPLFLQHLHGLDPRVEAGFPRRQRLARLDGRVARHGRRLGRLAEPADAGGTGHHGHGPAGHRPADVPPRDLAADSGGGRAGHRHRPMLALRRATRHGQRESRRRDDRGLVGANRPADGFRALGAALQQGWSPIPADSRKELPPKAWCRLPFGCRRALSSRRPSPAWRACGCADIHRRKRRHEASCCLSPPTR